MTTRRPRSPLICPFLSNGGGRWENRAAEALRAPEPSVHSPHQRPLPVHRQHLSTADLMGTSTDDDIADPIGQPRAVYERMVDELDDLLGRLVALGWRGAPEPVSAPLVGAEVGAPSLALDEFEPAAAARAMATA